MTATITTAFAARVAAQGGGGDGINEQVPPAERIVAFEILGDEWLPDSDVLTPTLKLKRRGVNQRFAAVIEAIDA